MNFDHILLEKEQEDLFIRIVEAVRKVPRKERLINAIKVGAGDLLIVGGYKEHVEIDDVADGDLSELTTKGILSLTSLDRDNENYAITPEGFQYYEWLMKEMGKPVERIEKYTFNYLDSEDFRKNYTVAYEKLKQAEELLWSSDSDANFSAIGHHCREAMQEFADRLYEQVTGKTSEEPKASTVKRIRAVIETKSTETGKTVTAFLEALLPFWGTVSDLVQRQEHAGQKEGEPINWEDARRVIFQTANVMFEFHRTLMR